MTLNRIIPTSIPVPIAETNFERKGTKYSTMVAVIGVVWMVFIISMIRKGSKTVNGVFKIASNFSKSRIFDFPSNNGRTIAGEVPTIIVESRMAMLQSSLNR